MSALTDVLSLELLPWLRGTASIGVAASIFYKAMNVIQVTWQRQPLIAYDLEIMSAQSGMDWQAYLKVYVLNRAPVMIEISQVEIVAPVQTQIRRVNSDPSYGNVAQWPEILAPYVPGAAAFPTGMTTFDLRWPEGQRRAKIKVSMRSKHHIIARKRCTIKLPTR